MPDTILKYSCGAIKEIIPDPNRGSSTPRSGGITTSGRPLSLLKYDGTTTTPANTPERSPNRAAQPQARPPPSLPRFVEIQLSEACLEHRMLTDRITEGDNKIDWIGEKMKQVAYGSSSWHDYDRRRNEIARDMMGLRRRLAALTH